MATPVARYLDPDASGSGTGADWTNAYTTVGAAFSDIVSDYSSFVSSDVIVTLNVRGTGADTITTSVPFSSTTDATRYLIIDGSSDFPADGVFDSGKYHFDGSDLSDSQFDYGGNKIHFKNLQFLSSETVTYIEWFKDTLGSGGELIIENCIVKWADGTSDGEVFRILNSTSVLTVTNSVFYDEAGRIIEAGSTGAKQFTNCTFFGNATISGGGNGESIIYKNCLFEDNTAFGAATIGSGSNYNSTDSASPPTNWGANSLDTQDVTFENQAGDNFALGSADTALHAAGVGTTDSDVPSTDILGNPRGVATTSIGAFEYGPNITSVSTDDTIGAAENPWNITGTGFGAD